MTPFKRGRLVTLVTPANSATVCDWVFTFHMFHKLQLPAPAAYDFCVSLSIGLDRDPQTFKWLAVKTASEMTYTVFCGALNSTQSNPWSTKKKIL